jgi:hypothetical protein
VWHAEIAYDYEISVVSDRGQTAPIVLTSEAETKLEKEDSSDFETDDR